MQMQTLQFTEWSVVHKTTAAGATHCYSHPQPAGSRAAAAQRWGVRREPPTAATAKEMRCKQPVRCHSVAVAQNA
jgi:hypothetical protein